MKERLSKEERRKQLLTAAMVAFGKKGYHGTQVSDIIYEADVARGTFYLYFEGKREIFDALLTEILQKVKNEVTLLPRDAVDKIPAQMMGNLERITHLLLDNPTTIKLLFSDAVGLDTEFDHRLKQFYEDILDLIRRGLRQGQEMGFVRKGNIHVLATSLLGCFKEVFYQYLLGTEKPTAEEIIREIYALVMAGLRY